MNCTLHIQLTRPTPHSDGASTTQRFPEIRGPYSGGWSPIKKKAAHGDPFPVFVVIPLGLEPKTVCLEGRCSIQLSYGTMKIEGAKKQDFRELSALKGRQCVQGGGRGGEGLDQIRRQANLQNELRLLIRREFGQPSIRRRPGVHPWMSRNAQASI